MGRGCVFFFGTGNPNVHRGSQPRHGAPGLWPGLYTSWRENISPKGPSGPQPGRFNRACQLLGFRASFRGGGGTGKGDSSFLGRGGTRIGRKTEPWAGGWGPSVLPPWGAGFQYGPGAPSGGLGFGRTGGASPRGGRLLPEVFRGGVAGGRRGLLTVGGKTTSFFFYPIRSLLERPKREKNGRTWPMATAEGQRLD